MNAQIIGGNPTKPRRNWDEYPTPPEVTVALIDFLRLTGSVIWEPACGEGKMSEVFRSYGNTVIETDIQQGVDFLSASLSDIGSVDFIITNPPFRQASAFIRHAAELGKPFAYLLKSQFWHAASRINLFNDLPPTFVLPLTWRPNFTGQGSSLMDVMWCIWLTPWEKCITTFRPLTKPAKKEQE